MELTERVEEDLRCFVLRKLDRSGLKAYDVNVDVKTVTEDNDDVLVETTKKGASLTPRDDLFVKHRLLGNPFFVEDPSTDQIYVVHQYVFRPTETEYNVCQILEILSESYDARKVRMTPIPSTVGGREKARMFIPERMVEARLTLKMETIFDEEETPVDSNDQLTLEGKPDKLVQEAFDYLKGLYDR
jgi:hypothetical protein